jgi:Ca2+-dependent lipid-binding protein
LQGVLQVTVAKAYNLVAMDTLGLQNSSDPFVRLSIRGDDVQKTKV